MSEKLKLKRQKSASTNKNRTTVSLATTDPVASVLVDAPVSHLEALYDYLVPEELSNNAVIGTKVLIEFGNSKTEGLVVARINKSLTTQKLKPILALSSPPEIIPPSMLRHLELVRDRFGGSFWNLIKQSVPPRIIKEESHLQDLPEVHLDLKVTDDFQSLIGRADLGTLKGSEKVRWAITTPLAFDAIKFVSQIAILRASQGQVLLLVPDEKDIRNFKKILLPVFQDYLVEYGSHLPKNVRYRNFLRVKQRKFRLILASRSGGLLPLEKNATVIVYSDLDSSHYELHSPGWNTRDITLLRPTDNSLIFISSSHSLEIERLVSIGWMESKRYKRAIKHNYLTIDKSDSYIPQLKHAISKGNVLVSVAEKGYANLFLCTRCRNSARCECGGKLQINLDRKVPQCYLCQKNFTDWRCLYCADNRPYVISKGIDRTAEEIGRALSKTSILISSGSKQIEVVPSGRHVVISTPGSEPLGEFAGVFLLDGERIFNRPTLRSEELAGFLWWNLIGKASLNAEIFLSLPNNHPLIQSILRRDPSYLASHQLVERKNAKMPPYFRIASVEGDSIDISKFAENLRSSTNYEITGPMLLNKTVSRLIIRATLERGSELVDLLDDVVKIQSIKGKGIFKIRFDQFDI